MLYITLALAGLLPAACVLHRRQNAALAATCVAAAALVHLADWLASGALGLYKYHPWLFSNPIVDDAAGVVLAELIFVTSLAVLLVSQVPSWRGPLIGVAIVTVLEYGFHRVGALEYKGWKLWYTSAGFIGYFSLVRWYWLSARREGVMGGWPHVLKQLALASVSNGLFAIVLWASKAVYMPVTILPNQDNNQALLRFLWHACISVPLAYWVLAGTWLARPWRLLSAMALSIASNWLFAAAGLRTFQPPWNPLVHGLLQSVFFALACLVDDWIQAPSNQPQVRA